MRDKNWFTRYGFAFVYVRNRIKVTGNMRFIICDIRIVTGYATVTLTGKENQKIYKLESL